MAETDSHEDVMAILRVELELVNILHHRNKNQHHSASWFRYLKLLKSCLTRMLAAGDQPIPASVKAVKSATVSQISRNEALRQQCTLFMDKQVSMQIAFSQIIGTGQYVPLGMVLLGVLARVWKVVSELVPYSREASSASEQLSLESAPLSTLPKHEQVTDDVGIVVERSLISPPAAAQVDTSVPDAHFNRSSKNVKKEQKVVAARSSTAAATSSAGRNERTPDRLAKKKKKRKASSLDEIDSIFG